MPGKIGGAYSDEEYRRRSLFAMPHIHSHSFIDYTEQGLDACVACQQDDKGYLDWNHYVGDDGKICMIEASL